MFIITYVCSRGSRGQPNDVTVIFSRNPLILLKLLYRIPQRYTDWLLYETAEGEYCIQQYSGVHISRRLQFALFHLPIPSPNDTISSRPFSAFFLSLLAREKNTVTAPAAKALFSPPVAAHLLPTRKFEVKGKKVSTHRCHVVHHVSPP